MAHRRRTLVLAAVALVVAASVATGWILLPGIIEDRVIAEARARRVGLEIAEVEVSWGQVRLVDVDLEPIGVERASAHADLITVELDWFTPSAMDVDELVGSLEGVAVLGDLAGWISETSPDHLPVIPVDVGELVVSWRERGASEPSIVLGADAATLGADSGRLLDAVAAIEDKRYGPADISWASVDGGIAIWSGAAERERASVAATIRPGVVEARLTATELGRIADFLSIELPRRQVFVEAEVDIELREDDGPAALVSHAEMRMLGFVPPHPKELDGILFGDATIVTVDALMDPDRRTLRLTQIGLEAGALRLEGEGHVKLGLDRSTAALKLRGAVPCRQLTASAVAAHLGREAGTFAGALVEKALTGSVAVELEVTASSERFDRPTVQTSATVGCKIDLFQGLPKPNLFDFP